MSSALAAPASMVSVVRSMVFSNAPLPPTDRNKPGPLCSGGTPVMVSASFGVTSPTSGREKIKVSVCPDARSERGVVESGAGSQP